MIRNLFALVLLVAGVVIGVYTFVQYRGIQAHLAPFEGADGPVPDHIARTQRSILLVTVDTTRADHLEPYGYQEISTPAFNELAQAGVLFTQANSVAPITLPAHSSILTGLYPNEHGVRNNGIHYLSDNVETLAERLAAQGYRAAAFVSAAVLERQFGLDQGFEVYDDDLSAGALRRPRMVADRPAEATVDAAYGWLDSLEADEKFFLWVHFYDPHAAYSPPAPFRDLYRERLYDGEIAYMDAQLATLLDHPMLDRESTIVAVVGDHGESLGQHGERTHALLAYQSTLSVPFFLRVPGLAVGIEVHQPVSQVDVVPTLLDLIGMRVPDELSGRSLTPLFTRAAAAESGPLYGETYLPFYTYGWAKLKTLRAGRWKYIDAPNPELYDLHRDPNELSNLIDIEAGMAHDLHRALEEQFQDSVDEPRLDLDTDALDRLRGLGYLAVGSGTRYAAERPDPKDVIHLHVGLERARRFLDDRLWDRAVNQLEAVLEEDPTNIAAHLDLASALEGAEQFDEAIDVLKQALDLDPGYAPTLGRLGNVEFRRGNHETAIELYDAALKIDSKFMSARVSKANAFAMMGHRDEAVREAQTLITQRPDSPTANLLYARIVEIPAGDLEAAERRLVAVTERDPFLAGAWVYLGAVLEARQLHGEAEQAYRQGLSKQPDDAGLHARLGLLLARQHGGVETERHLREALRLGPGSRPDLHLSLGAWLAERGRFEAAQAEYQKVLSRQPDNDVARNNRAIAYFQTGKVAEAITEFEAILERHPNYADAHSNLSAAAIAIDDWQKAETHARKALELNPEAAEAYANLGIALDEQGRSDQAEAAFREALVHAPDYQDARLNLAITLKRQRRWVEAEKEFVAVLDAGGIRPLIHRELGELYAGPLRKPQQARAHFNAYLAAAPGAQDVEDIREALGELELATEEPDSP